MQQSSREQSPIPKASTPRPYQYRRWIAYGVPLALTNLATYAVAKNGFRKTARDYVGKPLSYVGRLGKNLGSAIWNTPYPSDDDFNATATPTPVPKSEKQKNFVPKNT